MNSLVLLIVCVAILGIGYVCYGGWLCKQWGVGESKTETPAHTMADGVDYVPAKAPVLMGHHFSSIAGAGPITGPIGAAMFGWLPVTLWILIGGIFFGGVHDFGALFASVRSKGQSIGEIISANMSKRAKQLFIIFSYLTLILVVAAFASIVASTFGAVYDESGALDMAKSATPATVAMISILFILIAIVFGFCVYRRNMPMGIASVFGVLAIVLIMTIGMNFHPIYLSTKAWMWIVGLYIAIASVTPVWILLQPRDYLSSFLLYAMLAVAAFGVIVAHPTFDSSFPAVTSFAVDNGNGTQYMFPVLFTTVACGAISGFHSLVSSGTTSKQLDNEGNARLVGYGSMLLEGVLAVVSVIAAGYVGGDKLTELLKAGGPVNVFADGVGTFMTTFGFSFGIAKGFVALTISAFAMTTLDTSTRLGRFIFQEIFTKIDDQTGEAKQTLLTNPYIATAITVILSGYMSLGSYLTIWPIFGAANQLLAALSLLAVGVWLKATGKNNLMVIIPMMFMFCVTLVALVQIIFANMAAHVITALGTVLFILAVALFFEARKYIFGSAKAE